MQPPAIHVSIESWIGAALTLGFLIPVLIASVAGGYILGTFVVDRFAKTVVGTHVRHFFSRIAPAKRFESSDHDYILNTIRRAIADGRLGFEDRVS